MQFTLQSKDCSPFCNFFCIQLNDSRIPRCLNCFPKNMQTSTSKCQQELIKFCKQYFPKLSVHNRNLIYPQQLDIYIKELNLAIEFNGIYWYSIEKLPKNYHLNKSIACQNLGIRLIHIWQDEWNNNKQSIKQFLINIFINNEIIPQQLIFDRCVYSTLQFKNLNIKLLPPKNIKHKNFICENCGYIKILN